MPPSSSLSPAWFPLPILPPLVSWTVEADGHISAFAGPGAALAPMGASCVKGQHYTDILGGMDVAEGVRLALRGSVIASIFSGWGRQWFTILQPELCEAGAVVRVHGTSFVLPEGATSPESSDEDFDAWICRHPVRVSGGTIRPGDVLTREGGEYTWGRTLRPEEADSILRRQASAFRPVSEPLDRPAAPALRGGAPPLLRVL